MLLFPFFKLRTTVISMNVALLMLPRSW